jgi:hypothetical protein
MCRLHLQDKRNIAGEEKCQTDADKSLENEYCTASHKMEIISFADDFA